MTDESRVLNLHQRLNAIKKAVSYVQKDTKVSGGGEYMAVTHDAVTAATRGLFVEHGVLVLPSEINSAIVDSGMVTGKGNPIIRFEAKYRIAFVNVDAPDDRTCIEITAHALDQGDKAPGKALSYATKAAVLKVLQLETGVDDEGREATKPAKHADIPLPEQSITPTSGAGEGLEPDRLANCDTIFSRIVDFMDAKDIKGASDLFYSIEDTDERVYVWSKLRPHKRLRADIKAMHDKHMEKSNGPI